MGQPEVVVQSERKRSKNFDEVSLGYPKKLALEEARRALQCLKPGEKEGCPLGVDIPGFVRALSENHAVEALAKIREQNPLPSVCGRVCTAPCEISGLRNDQDDPPGIRALERFAADFGKPKFAPRKAQIRAGKKVAVVGSGPAGLSAAAALAQKGYRVTVFEAFDQPGGVLRYGIPSFRLPAKVLDEEIQEIKLLDVEFKTNCYAGKSVNLTDLNTQGFEAILLATGAGVPQLQDLPGVNLGGVYYGEEFLLRLDQFRRQREKDTDLRLGPRVVVLGSQYLALDCARAALRLGKQVTWVSPEALEDKKVVTEESVYAAQEGVHIEALVKPLEIMGNDRYFARAVKCVRLDYADTRATGHWELTPVPDSGFVIEADSVIVAMGHTPNSLIKRDVPQLKVNDNGTIWTNPNDSTTSMRGVFACGNVVTNTTAVVEAMASGKKAAEHIDNYLKSK